VTVTDSNWRYGYGYAFIQNVVAARVHRVPGANLAGTLSRCTGTPTRPTQYASWHRYRIVNADVRAPGQNRRNDREAIWPGAAVSGKWWHPSAYQ